MSRLRILIMAALITAGGFICLRRIESSWDGTWSGMLNKTEPVSVTIAGDKVVGYTIRGFAPLGIEAASVTGSRDFPCDRSRLPREPDEAE
jgi:hypothetical protein